MTKERSVLSDRYTNRILPAIPLSYSQLKQTLKIRNLIKTGEFKNTKLDCLCRKNSDAVLSLADAHNVPCRIVLCQECGLIRIDPRMSDETLNQYYTEFFPAIYYDQTPRENIYEAQNSHGKIILEYLGADLRSNSTVVEIGCGLGGILSAFHQKGHRVTGAELDPVAAKWGSEHGGFEIRAGSPEKLNDLNGTVDLVILSHVVEHLPDPKTVLKQVRELLKPDGILYVEVPGIKSLSYGQKGMCGITEQHPHHKDFLEYVRSMHLWYFELETLKSLASESGFSLARGDELVRGVFKKAEEKTNWPTARGPAVLGFLQALEDERVEFDHSDRLLNAKIWTRTFLSWIKHEAKNRLSSLI